MKKLLNSEAYGLCLFKLSLKMKLTVLLTIVSLFQIQANTYSQRKKSPWIFPMLLWKQLSIK